LEWAVDIKIRIKKKRIFGVNLICSIYSNLKCLKVTEREIDLEALVSGALKESFADEEPQLPVTELIPLHPKEYW